MFNQEYNYCRVTFARHGIPEGVLPDIGPGLSFLSYMEPGDTSQVFIGFITRLLNRTKRSALHEMVHTLIERFPLTEGERSIFGTADEWEADQSFIRGFMRSGKHLNFYAGTHPEEDFVETACALLQERSTPVHYVVKKRAITAWLRRVKREAQAYA